MHHTLHLPTITTFTFFLLLFLASSTIATTTNHRRLLHQPFFPLDQSQPPTTSPTPQPQPKYPFSTTVPPPDPTTTATSQSNNPFFPFYPSPPPPPPPPSTTAATFPANISSLVLPSTSSHSHHKPTKLVSLVISISLFSTLVFASVFYLLRYHRHRLSEREHDRSLKSDSLRLFPPDTTPSDASDTTEKSPPPAFPRHAPASTSSEILYLGTVVSSRDANDVGSTAAIHPPAAAAATPVSYERLGSPDLQPLPPLPRHNSHVRYSCEVDQENDNAEEDEEFFSPRGSTVNNASPYRTKLSPPVNAFRSGDNVHEFNKQKLKLIELPLFSILCITY